MSEFPIECTRCGTPLKKQVIGSNEFYYCRKCGCTSSAASVSVPARSANQQVNIKSESAPIKNESAPGAISLKTESIKQMFVDI